MPSPAQSVGGWRGRGSPDASCRAHKCHQVGCVSSGRLFVSSANRLLHCSQHNSHTLRDVQATLHPNQFPWDPSQLFNSYKYKVVDSIPDQVIGFFNWPNPYSRTMALGSTRLLTGMSTRNLPVGKGRPARKVATSTPSVSQPYRKCGSLDVSQPYGPLRPVTGIALHFIFITVTIHTTFFNILKTVQCAIGCSLENHFYGRLISWQRITRFCFRNADGVHFLYRRCNLHELHTAIPR
jgi:hypothetical protein